MLSGIANGSIGQVRGAVLSALYTTSLIMSPGHMSPLLDHISLENIILKLRA